MCASVVSAVLWRGLSLFAEGEHDLRARIHRKAILLDFFRHAFDGSGADKWGPFSAAFDASK